MTRQKPESTHPNAAAFPSGIGGPALRALKHAGIGSVAEAARWAEEDLLALHGLGPRAITLLKQALRAEGRKFRT